MTEETALLPQNFIILAFKRLPKHRGVEIGQGIVTKHQLLPYWPWVIITA